EDERHALAGAGVAPPADESSDEVALVGSVRRCVTGEEHHRPRDVEAEPMQQRLVLARRAAAVVDVSLWPAGDDDPSEVDAVVADEILAHRLVLDDVAVEVR